MSALLPVNITQRLGDKEYAATVDVALELIGGKPTWYVYRVIVWRSRVGGALIEVFDGEIDEWRVRKTKTPEQLRRSKERRLRELLGDKYDEVIHQAWLMAKPVKEGE